MGVRGSLPLPPPRRSNLPSLGGCVVLEMVVVRVVWGVEYWVIKSTR